MTDVFFSVLQERKMATEKEERQRWRVRVRRADALLEGQRNGMVQVRDDSISLH